MIGANDDADGLRESQFSRRGARTRGPQLLQKALHLSARDIRCTSVDGYKLPLGTHTDDRLREEILQAQVFLGIVTPSSASSVYVLFEMGARWGANRYLAPVLARGGNADLLEGPLSAVNALVLTRRNEVLQLVQDLAEFLSIQLEPLSSFQAEVEAVVAAAEVPATTAKTTEAKSDVSISDDEVRVLQVLAAVTDDIALEDITTRLKLSDQKAKFFLSELGSKGLSHTTPVVYGVTTYSISQAGRRLLVERGLL
jgi:hypothetical protein